jgi:hypothetical protein
MVLRQFTKNSLKKIRLPRQRQPYNVNKLILTKIKQTYEKNSFHG